MGQVISTLTALPGGLLDTRCLGDIRRRKRSMLAVQLVGIPVAAVYLFKIDFTVVIVLNVGALNAHSIFTSAHAVIICTKSVGIFA